LPPELQAHKSLEKFKDPGALARSYLQMESYQGRSVAIPGPEAKPEERTAFYQKLGVPDAPDKYEVAAPEGLGELDPAVLGAWKQTFHRLHLTPDQVKGLTSEFFGSPMWNPAVAGEQLRTQAVTALRAEWGGAYDHNLAVAQQAAKQIAGREVIEVLEATGLGNHPAFVRLFAKLGRDYADDGQLLKDAQSGGILGPADAQQRIDAIFADRTHPYHRGDKAAVDEMTRLFQLKAQALER
jgi:hypothetical protein